jgi:osmotically-inducible protein OsmY
VGAISPDQTLTKQVSLKLANRGITSPCSVTVQTKNGEVILSGSVQYAHQKAAAVRAAAGIYGVRRVTDNMTVGVKRRH